MDQPSNLSLISGQLSPRWNSGYLPFPWVPVRNKNKTRASNDLYNFSSEFQSKITYVENPKELTKKKLELVSGYASLQDTR